MTSPAGGRAATLVGAVLFAAAVAYVAATFEWAQAIALLARLDLLTFVAGSSAALLGYWAVRALRWRLLLRAMGVHCALASVYLCSSVALSLAVLTPLQSGELLKVELLRKCAGVGRLPGYSAFALERIADLYAIVALGLLAYAWMALGPSVAALLCAGVLLLPVIPYRVLRSSTLGGRMGDFVAQTRSGLPTLGVFTAFIGWTFAGWLLVALAWHACLCSLGICLGGPELLGLLAAVTLATILSMVPAGLGVAEVGISAILVRYGFEPSLAQAGALALRAFSLLVILLGAFHLLALKAHWGSARAPTTNE